MASNEIMTLLSSGFQSISQQFYLRIIVFWSVLCFLLNIGQQIVTRVSLILNSMLVVSVSSISSFYRSHGWEIIRETRVNETEQPIIPGGSGVAFLQV